MEGTIEDTVVFTPQQVHDFVDVTEDTNPIHQGPEPVVPGLLLALGAKTAVEERTLPSRYCRELKLDFRRIIYAGKEVKRSLNPVTGAYPLDAKVVYRDGTTVSAECALRYDAETQKPEKTSGEHHRVTNHRLWLSTKAATCVSLVLGKTQPDYEALAIGLLSKVLLEHGRELIEANKGRTPAYLMQKFTFPERTQLGEQELSAQASTRINGTTRVVTKVQMISNGQPIYWCQTHIAFVGNS